MRIEVRDGDPALVDAVRESIARVMADELVASGVDLTDEAEVAVTLVRLGHRGRKVAELMDRAIAYAACKTRQATSSAFAGGAAIAEFLLGILPAGF